MWRRVPLFLLLVVTVNLGGATEPERMEWTTLVTGVWHLGWGTRREADGVLIRGNAFRIDPRGVHITMLDARSGERSGALVQTLREESGAYLVVNASFFDPENRPLGLVIGDRIEQSKLRSLDQGIFLISDGRPRIQHSRDPLPERIDVALQAFPRLVVEGRVLKLKGKRSRRTALCVPGDGSVIIVVIPQAVSLLDLATNLARPITEGGLGCWDALNLDGGPSTQLSLQTPPLSLEIPGAWPVPNALAILPPT